ncbi:MAG: hypothetical protein OJJ21_07955 [Ferrovibrio sp.]|uniref:hypothetical protein n=1 Tax=Ferrovibrio sp. TaxID=1917215 RepID=UPI0026194232|nr:hypothetical protein [Ferrovibrio sp.]MCW0233515.1 hypothetical protein [Ferrovibrio sp.]
MSEISITQFIGILAAAANIGIAVMIIILLGERSHAAWTRVRLKAEELTGVKEDFARQVEDAVKAVQTLHESIADLKNQVTRAEQDLESLTRRHKETDLPFGYTATIVDIVDRRYRTWRVVVRNADLGAQAGSFSHPAHKWIEGRFYEVPAPNMEYAVQAMQQRFLLRDGFTVDPAPLRGSVAEAPAPAASLEAAISAI